jgi:hypothetical protein
MPHGWPPEKQISRSNEPRVVLQEHEVAPGTEALLAIGGIVYSPFRVLLIEISAEL